MIRLALFILQYEINVVKIYNFFIYYLEYKELLKP